MLYFTVKQVVRKDNVHKSNLCAQRSGKQQPKMHGKGVETGVEAGWKRGGSRVEARYRGWKRTKSTLESVGLFQSWGVRTFLFYNI